MAKKLKFKPIITQVRLNPEQAVAVCPCYDRGTYQTNNSKIGSRSWCYLAEKGSFPLCCKSSTGALTT